MPSSKTMRTRIAGSLGVVVTIALMLIGAAATADAAATSGPTTKSGPTVEAELKVQTMTAFDDYADCALGYVCLYPQNASSWPGSNPTSRWYQYGTYNLVNELGWHWIFNNQTDDAWLSLCTGYGGGGSCHDVAGGWAYWTDFTPINSIVIRP